ncbi:MAG: hypothetical protein Q4B42_03580, partial [Oscillospiraceae bacterium]|nr:hypothetical protein [Oscillospiraceae bacterium]
GRIGARKEIELATEMRRCTQKPGARKKKTGCSSTKPWADEDGILHIGLYEFLLNQDSLEL